MIKERFTHISRKAFLSVVLLCCVCTSAFAYDFKAVNSDGVTIYYNRKNNQTEAEVTYESTSGYNSYSGIVNIPETVTDGTTSLKVTSIGLLAFSYCKNLTSVTIPKFVTSIGAQAFMYCRRLTSVTFPNSVTNIDNGAFYYCNRLKEVTLQSDALPDTNNDDIFYIASDATLYCPIGLGTECSKTKPWSNFKTIEASVVSLADGKHLSDYITSDIKSTITKLKVYGEINNDDITFLADMATNGALSVLDLSGATATSGDLIGTEKFEDCTKLTSIDLPQNVTSIGEKAFSGCSSLTSITIPDKVESIGASAFYSCTSLISIAIPDGVTSIGDYTFSGCSNLTSINIPDNVTSIGASAFYSCTGLTSVTIPDSVKSIEDDAFGYCSSLNKVVLLGDDLPKCGSYVFKGIPTSATLYCKSSLIASCTEEPWKNFGTIKSLPSVTISTVGIATGCFDFDIDFTEVDGVKAYIASGFSPSKGNVLLTRVMHIPAGTGFVVKGDEGKYEIPVSATDYVYSNLLVGTLVETNLSQPESGYTNYVLDNGDKGVGFYLPSDVKLQANKAYLKIPTSTGAAKRSIGISFEDEEYGTTTGFISVKELNEGNGGVSNKSVIYNLNGQRKQSLSKGLNIVDGKKILIK